MCNLLYGEGFFVLKPIMSVGLTLGQVSVNLNYFSLFVRMLIFGISVFLINWNILYETGLKLTA